MHKKGGTMEHLKDKEALLRLLPKKFTEEDTKSFGSDLDGKCGYNNALFDTAEKLSKQVVGVEEVAKIIFLHDKWFDGVESKEACWKLIIEAKKHSGDCTNEAHSCQMCIQEDYFKQAQALTKEFVILKREVK